MKSGEVLAGIFLSGGLPKVKAYKGKIDRDSVIGLEFITKVKSRSKWPSSV